MKIENREKLDKCLELLQSTELDEPISWLWTWKSVQEILNNLTYKSTVTTDEIWQYLCEAVESGEKFSLEFGIEALEEDVLAWMYSNDYVMDTSDEDLENES